MGSGAFLPAIATRPAKIRRSVEGARFGRGDEDWRWFAGPPDPLLRAGLAGRVRPAVIRLDDGWPGVAWMDKDNESDEADRAISTGKLHALLRFHTRPIDVVVYHGSDREYWF
jgi:hypothetical protein